MNFKTLPPLDNLSEISFITQSTNYVSIRKLIICEISNFKLQKSCQCLRLLERAEISLLPEKKLKKLMIDFYICISHITSNKANIFEQYNSNLT